MTQQVRLVSGGFWAGISTPTWQRGSEKQVDICVAASGGTMPSSRNDEELPQTHRQVHAMPPGLGHLVQCCASYARRYSVIKFALVNGHAVVVPRNGGFQPLTNNNKFLSVLYRQILGN